MIDRLFPNPTPSAGELEDRYPARSLPDGALVTRFGPSPTGFVHLGGIYAAYISERFARQTNGVFMLRIEDTDQKREVEGAAELIVNSMAKFGITVDEGEVVPGEEKGDYGPYRQSERAAIYQTFVKQLVIEGKAYPCFASPELLAANNREQEISKIKQGYYGQWAVWRDRSEADIVEALDQGLPFVIRFRTPDGPQTKLSFTDQIRGSMDLLSNDLDIVILKSGGLPTYHMVHVVDDHLMRTTDVIRGDEWLSSLPLHLQLFDALGWTLPRYAHIAPIQKMDGASRRKLSKRKDPEASVTFYQEVGYTYEAVAEYLMNMADSSFEAWRAEHQKSDIHEFVLNFDNFSVSGALLDLTKLDSISRDVLANFTAEVVYDRSLEWARDHDAELAASLSADRDYAVRVFTIERYSDQPRKDLAKWSDLRPEFGYFFDALYPSPDINFEEQLAGVSLPDAKLAVAEFMEKYSAELDRDEWMVNLRSVATNNGFAPNVKEFKKNPTAYKGHVGDIAKVIRVLLVGRNKSPDLWEVMSVMGRDRVEQRIARLEDL